MHVLRGRMYLLTPAKPVGEHVHLFWSHPGLDESQPSFRFSVAQKQREAASVSVAHVSVSLGVKR